MAQQEQKLPKGLRFFNPHDNAPDFVIGSLVITPAELWDFIKENPALMKEYNGKKQLRLQVLKSKQGQLYAAVDTFEKKQQPTAAKQQAAPASDQEAEDDLPF